MALTVNILETFINSLELTGDVNSFSDDGTNTTINVSKTYQAREGRPVFIDGNEYDVLSIVNNESILVSGIVSNPETYQVPNPFYFHGTPILTDASIEGMNHEDKLPMIYLYEILRERDLPNTSRNYRESDLRLFFLDTANFGGWDTDDHYSKRLLGLNNLVDAFIDQAKKYSCCFYLQETTFTRINHVNFGKFTDNKGHTKAIFTDDLTGVELSFTLPLREC